MKRLGILWAQYGPYHLARAAALKQRAGPGAVQALELASQTSTYAWQRPETGDLITLCPGAVADRLSFRQVFQSARRTFAELKLEVCILPSYSPKQPLAALLAAKSLGIRTVMMNESHAGTARAQGLGAWVKRRLVGRFDAALVGGQPQKRYYTALGLPPEKIFTGYDAVDNDHFARKAAEVRSQAADVRRQYELPEHYFLSLGRFVAKKNLTTLIHAYRKFLESSQTSQTHLVLVGSGEEEPKLHALCQELNLPIYDKTELKSGKRKAGSGQQEREGMPETQSPKLQTPDARPRPPGVHFYGFRQVDENPAFYALADAFILPSTWEEWGLVVNEAMACGLPVVVSETAGCAEDLLEPGRLAVPIPLSAEVNQRLTRLAGRIRQNGFVFNPASAGSLADVLLALEATPALRDIMGQASRRIVEKFSCENFARNALLAAQAALG
jgi:glycosyltransferase involved in cell wall biosynthesis